MISFEILGEVTARQGAWTARLTPRQQRLLAALVLGNGAPVSRERLEGILWDSRAPYDPEKAINQVACEVRSQLRLASPDGGDLVLSSHGGYRLALAPEQADVLRFRDKADRARHSDGPDGAKLMRQALREWGPDVSRLYGGDPLHGLRGQWADSTRYMLRAQYRDAVIYCLSHDMSCCRYKSVLMECEQRAAADDPQALLDEQFTGIWMRAAACAGDPARAHTIFTRATDAATRAGQQPGDSLRRLNADLRAGWMPVRAVAVVPPQEASPLTTDPVNEVNVMTEQDPDDDTSAGPATGQQAVPGPKVRSKVVIGRITDGGSVTQVTADPGPGDYDTDGTIGVVGPQAQYIAVDLRKKS